MVFLLFLICLFNNISPGFASPDEESSVALKSSITLTCPTQFKDDFVIWYKVENRKDVEVPFSKRVFFPGLNQVQLRKISESDAGLYKCKTPMSGRLLRTFRIHIIDKVEDKKKVAAPRWTRLPEPDTRRDNSRAIVLVCRAAGENVKVKAYRIRDDGTKKLLRDSGVVVHRPTGSDSGRFMCQAENEGGKLVHEFTLTVSVNGRFSEWSQWGKCNVECGYGTKLRSRACTNPRPENGGRRCYGEKTDKAGCKTRNCETPQLVKFGYEITDSDLILSCAGKGIPTPTVEWEFNGKDIPNRYHPRSHKTVIPKWYAKSGSYSCAVRNNAGFYKMYINIKV